MKKRLFANWSFQQALFIVMGGLVVIQSIIDKQWWGMLLGSYFVIIGIFKIGCLSSNCYSPKALNEKAPDNIGEVDFEEIK